jgi:hypothetical protein
VLACTVAPSVCKIEPDVGGPPRYAQYNPVEGALGYCVVDALNTPLYGSAIQPVIPTWDAYTAPVNTSMSNFGFRIGIGTSCAFTETAKARPMLTNTIADINRLLTENIVLLL